MLSRSAPFQVALDPVFNSDFVHVADRLHLTMNEPGRDALTRSAQTCCAALYEIGLDRLVGNRRLWLDLGVEWLEFSELWPTPAERMLMLIPAAVEQWPGTQVLQRLKSHGYRLGVHVADTDALSSSLLSWVDVVVVASDNVPNREQLQRCKDAGKTLVATGVEQGDTLSRLAASGVSLFSGKYLEPVRSYTPHGPSRHGNPSIKVRLIAELYRSETDLASIEQLILQFPYLHVSIVRRAHSSYFQPLSHSLTLRQAIMVIGLHELRVLVATVMLAHDVPSLTFTLRQALIRAFMCQELARPFPAIESEHAFTTGFFSLMDRLLEIDLPTLLEEVPLHTSIRMALTTRSGELGALLSLAEEYEAMTPRLRQQRETDKLHRSYLEAVARTERMMSFRR